MIFSDFTISNMGQIEDASRFFRDSAIVIGENAVVTLTVSDAANIMQFTPQLDCSITNYGNFTVAFTLAETAAIVRLQFII